MAARLLHRPLFLRGSWGEDKLRFDSSGAPAQPYKTSPFSVAAIDISKVKLDGDVLALEGARVGVIFQRGNAMRFVALGRERIRIQLKGKSGQDFGPALDAIFTTDLKDVPAACSGPWRNYAETHWRGGTSNIDPADAPDPTSSSNDRQAAHPLEVGGAVKPPQVLQQVDPVFSGAARKLKYSGVVEVELWVGTDGVPSHFEIRRPAGLGLDEQALAAVERYRFAPATRNGTPVTVKIYVDVNFQIF